MTRVERSLEPRRSEGWWPGLRNLLLKESREWWGKRRWLTQAVVWLLVLNGFMALLLWVFPTMTRNGQPVMEGDPVAHAISFLFSLGAPALGVGVVILMQGVVLDETESGTAAWILSKPVTREAFILSKLLAHALGVLAVMVLLPGVVGYAELTLASGSAYSLPAYATGLGVLALHTLFYLALTLMLGVVTGGRGQVLGAALGFLLGGMVLVDVAGAVGYATPWTLSRLGTELMLGRPMPGWGGPTMVINALWVMAFTTAALVLFRRQEV